MNFNDLFKPYSPKLRGDLEEYLREYDGSRASNLFYGSKYFFIIRDRNWMIPGQTHIRVDQSPVPDIGYVVNSDFMLESLGSEERNMSLVAAKKGVYDPFKELKNKIWSISDLKIKLHHKNP